ncbi:MAG: WXG100 family type VII secretion target [Egibacteraceae bacterium]
MPNWENVTFDYGLAAEAAAECRGSAQVIDAVLDGLARQAPGAQADWTGRLADDFATEEPRTRADLERVMADLSTLADLIDAACDAARCEQRRREASREWGEQRRQEQRLTR